MCSNHDALFDKVDISFDKIGTIMISASLDKDKKIFLNIDENMRIRMNHRQRRYMNWHRIERFESAK
ncbi:hypothetical protein [Bacillus cereus group sp. BfR-BA-01309]|uniref:hypothetical protein n=1 Tax=Bacillus cereus group sp. BfR-BA-01309 TaxID=2920286 RepID=UPI0035C8F233